MERDPITGKTIRWRYDDGPMKRKDFEHDFATDGSVRWRMAGTKAGAADDPHSHSKKYEVVRTGEDVWTVAYLAPSGWTLTTVLDFASGKMVSFASNEKELVVQSGTFDRPDRS